MLWKGGIFVVLEPENLACEVILAVPIDEAEKLAKQIKEGQGKSPAGRQDRHLLLSRHLPLHDCHSSKQVHHR